MRLASVVHSRTLALVVLALAGCSDFTTPPSSPPPSGPQAHAELLGVQSVDLPPPIVSRLLSCPTTVAQRTEGVIGPAGGTLSVPGATIEIPPGAVDQDTTFVLERPLSLYAEVRIYPEGGDHYRFSRRVTISLAYGDCAPPPSMMMLMSAPTLAAAHVESNTLRILDVMPGAVDEIARVLVFTTDHLSSYIVAY